MSFEDLFKKLRNAVDEPMNEESTSVDESMGQASTSVDEPPEDLAPEAIPEKEKALPESENKEKTPVSPKEPELDHQRAWERKQEENQDRFEELGRSNSGK